MYPQMARIANVCAAMEELRAHYALPQPSLLSWALECNRLEHNLVNALITPLLGEDRV